MSTPSNDSDEEVSVPFSQLSQQRSANEAPVEDAIDEQDLRTEKQKEMDRLRAAEKFMAIDEGLFECTACSYVYEPKRGVRQSGILPDTPFEELPDSFVCPVCRSPKSRYASKKKIIAGFADNQQYGFGSNTMTAGQKGALIYGGLLLGFLILLSGYALN